MTKKESFYELMNIINEASTKIAAYEKTPRTYGTDDLLYVAEAHLIDTIGKDEFLTATDIAKKTYKTKGAVGQTIEKLLKKDLVYKVPDVKDTRRHILKLTEKGKTVFEHHRLKDETIYGDHLKNLNEYSKEDFEKSIQILKLIFE